MTSVTFKIKKTVPKTSTEKIKDITLNAIKKASQELVALGFKTETDPYGKRWKKKKKRNGKPTLIDSGKMRKSFRYIPMLSRVKITNAQFYATFHLTGTSKMVPRIFVPYGKSSKLWKYYIDKKVRTALAKAFK
jgi:phage gpG-like protein